MRLLLNRNYFISLIAIFIVTIFSVHYIKPYFVYDEANFIAIASRTNFFFPYPHENFGQIYWFFLKFLFTPIFTKFVFLIIWILNLICILSFFRRDQQLILLIFILSCPFIFWNGKIVSPDTLGFFLCTLSLFCEQR